VYARPVLWLAFMESAVEVPDLNEIKGWIIGMTNYRERLSRMQGTTNFTDRILLTGFVNTGGF
jgi:hypothetical protein